jgi:D-alanyl-D-alanine carboxypeptidase
MAQVLAREPGGQCPHCGSQMTRAEYSEAYGETEDTPWMRESIPSSGEYESMANESFPVSGESPFLLGSGGEASSEAESWEAASEGETSSELESFEGPEDHDGRMIAREPSVQDRREAESSAELANLTSDEIATIFGRKSSLVALHWLLTSNELQQAALTALLGKAGRRSVSILGSNLPMPSCLRLLSRLCQEAAEHTELGAITSTETHPLAEFEDESPTTCQHLDESRLSWRGASNQQLDFMREVFLQQNRNSCTGHTFINDLPSSDLSVVEQGICARKAAVTACQHLLIDARAAAASDPAAVAVGRIGIVSGYRSASQQLALWNSDFPHYFQNTREARQALPGGEFGRAALDYLAAYISQRLAAPGYSWHQNGLAIDFISEQDGVLMGADSARENRQRWKKSWFFRWLSSSAARYGFFPNPKIDEPWHWEFRGPVSPLQSETLFGETTIETHRARGVDREDAVQARQTVHAGRAEFSNTPLLKSHRGTQPDLILRWNDMTDPASVDVVVHLHGYSAAQAGMSLQEKEKISGLDFGNPDNPADPRSGRTFPTLCLLPRGSYAGGQPRRDDPQKKTDPRMYVFPALTTRSGLRDLIDYGFGKFLTSTGMTVTPLKSRLIVTAHSGGGAALLQALAYNDPSEIHVFDALYQDASALIAWAGRKIAAEIQNWRPDQARADGGLCVITIPDFGTDRVSAAVAKELGKAISSAPTAARPALQSAYRVVKTNENKVSKPEIHLNMPRNYGWLLLSDITGALPGTTQI